MTGSGRLPLWSGRSLVFLGILLVALNLRTAVSSISPIASQIAVDIPLDNTGLGLIGMVPPVIFAVSGLIVAVGVRKLSLEWLQFLAAVAMVGGYNNGVFDSFAPTAGTSAKNTE